MFTSKPPRLVKILKKREHNNQIIFYKQNGFHKIYRWISLIVEADDGVAEITDFKKTVHYAFIN